MSTGLEAERPASSGRVSTIVVWVVFAVLYAYPLFEGISNLIAVPQFYAEHKIAGVPWPLLILGVVAPAILYVAALLLGRGRERFPRTLLLAVGLAATNALFLSAVQLAATI